MRICVLSDCVFPTPTLNGHGLGLMTWQVAEGLLGYGHDVTLIAKEGSHFSGTLHTVAGAEYYDGEALLARDAMRIHRSAPFDVFLDNGHVHILADIYPNLPVVNVFHDVYQKHARCPVLLSEGQRASMSSQFDYAYIIPNTLNAEAFHPKFDLYSRDYVFFMGALSEIKQPLLAIEACARLGKPLIMAGGDIVGRFPAGAHEQVEVSGAVSGSKKHALLQNARVFLQLGVSESFGLTTLEANLCGTPVVAWPSGGSVDLIEYGTNGVFVAPSNDCVQATADAIERAWNIDRQKVRTYAEGFCNTGAQIGAYEDALIQCIEGMWW